MKLLIINNLLTVNTLLSVNNWLSFGAVIIGMALMLFLIVLVLAVRAKRYQDRQNRVEDEFAELIYRQNIGEIKTDENSGPADPAQDREKDWYE